MKSRRRLRRSSVAWLLAIFFAAALLLLVKRCTPKLPTAQPAKPTSEGNFPLLGAIPQIVDKPCDKGAQPFTGNTSRTNVFVFVGILSGGQQEGRRQGVRDAWVQEAQNLSTSVCKFVLATDEHTDKVAEEQAANGDIVFAKGPVDYHSILKKTYYVFFYAVANYEARFIIKTDDDAFLNMPPLLDMLKSNCLDPDCRNERLYVGMMARHGAVILDPDHKWNNEKFYNHTGLEKYSNYMMGGGYAVSGDVAAALVQLHETVGLIYTPIEDATFGYWLSPMALRFVDHPKVYAWGLPCCFTKGIRTKQNPTPRFRVQARFRRGLCGKDPWLILHKIDQPEKMRMLAEYARACRDNGSPLRAY